MPLRRASTVAHGCVCVCVRAIPPPPQGPRLYKTEDVVNDSPLPQFQINWKWILTVARPRRPLKREQAVVGVQWAGVRLCVRCDAAVALSGSRAACPPPTV